MNKGYSSFAEAELYRRKIQRRQRITERVVTILGGFFAILLMEIALVLLAVV